MRERMYEASSFEKVLLLHIYYAWKPRVQSRGFEIFAVPLVDGLTMEENHEALRALQDRGVIAIYVSGVRLRSEYLEEEHRRLICLQAEGALSDEDAYQLRKIDTHFYLAAQPELRARFSFTVG